MKHFLPTRIYLVWILALIILAMPFAYSYGLQALGIRPDLRALSWVCFVPRDFTLALEQFNISGILSSIGLLVTHQFFHLDSGHLMGNLMFLLPFGIAVEKHLGAKWFLLSFFSCGIAGGIVHWAFLTSSPIPLLGASGAIAGIMGVYVYLFVTRVIEWNWRHYMLVSIFTIAWLLPNISASLGYFETPGMNVAVNLHIGAFVAGVFAGTLFHRNRIMTAVSN